MPHTVNRRDFVRRYMGPILGRKTGRRSGTPVAMKEIYDLLKEGRPEKVIRKYDAKAPSWPADPRLFIGIASAYIQQGENLERAKALHEAAMEFFAGSGDFKRYALACAHRARVAYREQGYDEAMLWYEKAWASDPTCMGAWTNAFCHTSVERRLDRLTKLVARFTAVLDTPAMDTDVLSRRDVAEFFNEDAQLSWARHQPVFADGVMANVRNHA